ncbi:MULTISPECIES: helix-turn-helix transcriptional regulator [Alphaproteobacteria]|jgi:transcriptional regulator with XRE-family HTH domain|uniref:Helix-turn-helix domain protein n=2 Tax=Parvibaculum TaxID=256616 RepID=A7HU47_PARL1|nr:MULTISPECIES: helix-turn-helix transcriptional regulator [Hyphomicrobiales]MDX5417393.1 helix-turn-helix domain-containing protein [Alphaproteobacteria bacterium]PKQ01746.1 MAG: XRE family transcriptional regulator [Alphaproteobacteria bacterium HGW-Alphaproteobacteria-12]ABS63430.1 helix-turn-helix domain protein [Parvibaculum lavamentivorans DS-1]MAB13364.1 XRE family transcriptional regulator [Parvibaculum sp.]MBC7282984.1 helix-turn-helix transcriptional regulator [Hoeflea sp.]|tara:strand:+ start:2506 stop:2748 length:243 start_codon:yes stop_codon:yes gene_type:complete
MSKTLRTPRQRKLLALLIKLRKAKGLTQADVAARLKRTQSFVAKYEGGERRLDIIEFVDVVQALGDDPGDVLKELYKPKG